MLVFIYILFLQIIDNKETGIDVCKLDYITRDSQMLGFKTEFDWTHFTVFPNVSSLEV